MSIFEDVSRFGIIEANEEGLFINCWKTKNSTSNLASMGIYVFQLWHFSNSIELKEEHEDLDLVIILFLI